jgi:hypothetical protein
MGKFKYYLSTINVDNEKRIELISEYKKQINQYKNVELKSFVDSEFIFNCEIPDIEGGSMCVENINENRVLTYHNLSSLIEDFVFGYDDYFDEEEDLDEDPFDVDDEINIRFDLLLNYFIVLRKNIKTNKYSIVSESEVINCFNKYQENIMESALPANIEFEESEEFSTDFDNFIKEIENLVEKDFGRLTVTSGVGEVYEFALFRKNGELHNTMLEKKIEFSENVHNDNFLFEIDLNNFKKFAQHSFATNSGVGIILRTPISEGSVFDNKNKDKLLVKLYGFGIYLVNDKLTVNRFKANDLLKACTVNAETGEPIQAEKNVIYCGAEKDDVICGFDLV